MNALAKGPAAPGRWRALLPSVMIALSFVSSGAWLMLMLPPVPIAKALNLTTLGLWLLAAGLGAIGFTRPDRRIVWAVFAVLASIAVSFVLGGSHFAAAFYDLYADMPLIQWLAFPVVFVLAAGIRAERCWVERGLYAVVVLGAVMSVVLAIQQLMTRGSSVFGTTAYSVTALVPLIPIAVGLAASRKGAARALWYGCAAVTALVLGGFSGATMGTLAALFAVVVSVAIHPAVRVATSRGLRAMRLILLTLAGLMMAAMLFIQVPALSSRWVNADVLGTQRSAVSRVYLWQGAQDMLAARPLFGFGPSGYRVAAVDYLAPEALQFGADQLGNIDPTVFSPQSPHSVMWDIATRLGMVGLLAFGALGVAWATVLRGRLRVEGETDGMRAALAAGFVSALFSLTVNPTVFPIGLFAAVAAGLAIGAMGDRSRSNAAPRPVALGARVAMAVAGVLVVAVAGWLFLGEWTAYSARFAEPAAAVPQYEAALRITPGNPMMLRRLLENRLLLASDAEIGAAQAAVDTAPAYIRKFAPNLSNFAAYSLAQAARTGRTDLSWEQKLLTQAATQMPPIPSTVAEQLHLAVLSGDPGAVAKALPDAEKWGRPYPYLPTYLEAAHKLLATP